MNTILTFTECQYCILRYLRNLSMIDKENETIIVKLHNIDITKKNSRSVTMNKAFRSFIYGIMMICSLLFFESCASSSIFNTPNFNAARNVSAPDLSSYADYIVEKCVFPDGKIATAYVFNNIQDGINWQNQQSRKFDSVYKEYARKKVVEYESKGWDASFYKWYPTGPLTSFFKTLYSLVDRYGEEATMKIQKNNISPISFYNSKDLGQLALYMLTPDSVAQACYEERDGIYLLTISRPQYQKNVSKDMQVIHRNEFAYEIAFLPKEMYKVQPVKLNPPKLEPINPSSIPDSNYSLQPKEPVYNSKYYYDEILAYKLQWLAVKIACKGVYDKAYTGDFSANNPMDYYKTSYIKHYLVGSNGGTSKGTILFEGICFDYADFAYQDMIDNKNDYSNVKNFWMVGTFDDPSTVVTYRIAEKGEVSTMIINQTPVVVYSYQHIKTHGNATHHAWLWIQTTDGTLYWIDPTWTDNTGRPVYGIIRGGEEVQLNPTIELCINH